ncbi:MAG TPA: zincin-like metallopeptidase domain-containing protein [Aquabacterium sp.]|nr:zincin-like metallopeptidase domain-containing protein [Aquabacterium sp.]
MSQVLRDLYQSVTDQIVAALEVGTAPWIRPWTGADDVPANATTQRPYRGINVLLLNLHAQARGFSHNRWLTFQQALAVGAHVRKGEHGVPIVFFKMHEVDASDVQHKPADVRKVIPLLRSFTVFNVDQVDGLPPKLMPVPTPTAIWDALDAAEQLIDATGADVRHGGSRAFYAPTHDLIQLPPRTAFASPSDYYGTAVHELTHWTGHPSRCNRSLGMRHGIDAYAFEELVAEMGAAFLCSHLKLPGRLQHDSYIASWLAALRNDKRLIFVAASQAQKAADYLLAAAGTKESASAAIEVAA